MHLPWLALLGLVISGCGQPRGNVSGEVKFKGEPLPTGRITFLCKEGKHEVFSGLIDKGKFEILNIPAGPSVVTVATYKPGLKVAAPPGFGKMHPPADSDAPPPPPPPPDGKFVEIPRKYSQPDQSPLTYIVQSGDQVHHIDLTP